MLSIENELIKAVDELQPLLKVSRDGERFFLNGPFEVFGHDGNLISSFDIEMTISLRYPDEQPQVFEVGGRIPRTPDRHVNTGGSLCYGVWEEWLIRREDWSIYAFFDECLRPYFLGQIYYEEFGKWPGEERSHFDAGLLEAVESIIGRQLNYEEADSYLRCLASKDTPKGHWDCPCGSGERMRKCCGSLVWDLYAPAKAGLYDKLRLRLEQAIVPPTPPPAL